MEIHIKSSKLVKINVEFLWFGQVDTVNEKFQAIVCIESKWYENTHLTEYSPKTDWNPKLYIENSGFEKMNEDISYHICLEDQRTLITETRISEGKFMRIFNENLSKSD